MESCLVFLELISILSPAIAIRAECSRLNLFPLPIINRRWTRFLFGPGSHDLYDQTAGPVFRSSLVTDPYCMNFSFRASCFRRFQFADASALTLDENRRVRCAPMSGTNL